MSNITPIKTLKLEGKREKYVKEHFPEVDCGSQPLLSGVFVQLRLVPQKSKGGIELPGQTREFNEQQTCLGVVRALGPGCFKDRTSGKQWHEGEQFKVGDLVMVKRHSGRRFAVPIPGTEDRAVFVVLNEYDVDSRIRDDFDDLETLYDQIV